MANSQTVLVCLMTAEKNKIEKSNLGMKLQCEWLDVASEILLYGYSSNTCLRSVEFLSQYVGTDEILKVINSFPKVLSKI